MKYVKVPFTGLFLLMLLNGCQHVPEINEPQINAPIPAQWQAASNEMFPRSINWSDFKDPVLQDFLDRALVSNLDIKSTFLALENARIQLEASESRRGPVYNIAGPDISLDQGDQGSLRESYGFNGSVRYEVDFWDRIKNDIAQNELSVLDSETDIKIRKISVTAQVVRTYFSIRVQDELIRLQEEQIKILRQQKGLTDVNLEAGAVTRLSVDQLNVSIQQQLSSLENARAARQRSVHNLALLLGMPPQELDIKAVPYPFIEIPRLNPLTPAIVLAQRPDIQSFERSIIAANLSLDTARNAWYPSIGLSANAGTNSVSLSNLFSGSALAANLGATLNNTLLDNGDRQRTVRRSENTVEQTVLNYETAILSGLQEIEAALIDQEANLRQIEIIKLQEQSQDNVTRITRVKYETGAASAFDLITEQRNNLNVKQQSVQTWQQGMNTAVSLLQALGVEP